MANDIDWSQYETPSSDEWAQYEVPSQMNWSKYAIPEEKGLSGVGKDIWSGIKKTPRSIYDAVKQLPGELYGIGEQAVTEPKRIAKNIGTGFSNLGHGILNTPANITDYLVKRGILPQEFGNTLRQGEHNFGEMLEMRGQKSGDRLIQSAIELAPYLVGGGALGRAGGAALQAVGQNENPVTAALTVGALEGGGKLSAKAIKAGYDIATNPISKAKISEKVVDTAQKLRSKFNEEYQGHRKGAFEAGVDMVVPKRINNSEAFSQVLEENRLSGKPKVIPALSKEFYFKSIKRGLKPEFMKTFTDYLKNPTFENARGARSDLGKALESMKNKSMSDNQLKAYRSATKAKKKLDADIDRTLRNSSNPALADKLKAIDTEYSQYKPLLNNKNIISYMDKLKKVERSKGKGDIKPAQTKLVKSLSRDTDFQSVYGKEFPGIGINQFLPNVTRKILGAVSPLG